MPQQVPPPAAIPTGANSQQSLNEDNQALNPQPPPVDTLTEATRQQVVEGLETTQTLQHQQVPAQQPPQAASGNGQTNKKLNGLKNRIIQRPPPLILDKVSNFYDTTTTTTNESSQQNDNNNDTSKANHNEPEQIPNNNTQPLLSTATNANQKFWASLNQNAAALKYRQTGPSSISSTTNTTSNDITKSSINSPNNLGADLIITQRHSSSVNQATKNNNKPIIEKSSSTRIDNFNSFKNNNLNKIGDQHEESNHVYKATESSKPHDVSNNSENDELVRPVSENGGNLIGVDHSSPPPPDVDQSNKNHIMIEPPTSATRPRSNNPFLEMEDEDHQSNEKPNTIHNNQNNFSNRPASFIAATNAASFMNQQRDLQKLQHSKSNEQSNTSYSTATSNGDNTFSSRHLAEQFRNLRINSGTYLQHMYNEQQTDADQSSDQIDSMIPKILEKQQFEEAISAIYGTSKKQPVASKSNQSIYGTYGQKDNLVKYDSNINVDSEIAVNNPLPTNSMQLPNWIDAIYHLNNAILDTSSVGGGAENGQFIYIVESGDIILELDHLKISGYTLVEFNQLLETKSVHHLSAVQTKHSKGLTKDLKPYLNSTFPKNSEDKKLQNLIRENIYRRTVPCTTRPPRNGEVHMVDYHFLSKDQFVDLNNRGLLLECGMYGEHYYGTMRPYCDVNNSTIYGSLRRKQVAEDMQQPLNPSHPIVNKMEAQNIQVMENLYENQESLRMFQLRDHPTMSFEHQQRQPVNMIYSNANHNTPYQIKQRPLPVLDDRTTLNLNNMEPSNLIDSEPLPLGWEKVIDPTYGTYYIDHNTQRTQYEKPYEIELTKGAMGLGFTLVEAENGVLLVRSIIHGGPAHLNGTIRPGDILLSAVGVSVFGLQHTDIARLFSTFAVGDRVRLTFARSAYVVDANLVPNEVFYSNGTDGDVAVVVNNPECFHQLNNSTVLSQDHHVLVQQEFDSIPVTLKRGDQGFGFTISDSIAGQKVRKIQNSETCVNLKQGDILISLNGQDITKLSHKQVVELLKNCPSGQDASLIVKRKKRFRSKTPMALHTETGEFTGSPPQRNCKTPNLDGLMLRRSIINKKNQMYPSSWSSAQIKDDSDNIQSQTTTHSANLMVRPSPGADIHGSSMQENYSSLPGQLNQNINPQPIYGINTNHHSYYNNQAQLMNQLPVNTNRTTSMIAPEHHELDFGPQSMPTSDRLGMDNMTNSVQLSETSLPPMKFADINGLNQTNQYNNFMNNDRFVMMQMHQPQYKQSVTEHMGSNPIQNMEYNQMPLYSNSDIMANDLSLQTYKPSYNTYQYQESLYETNMQNNCYANNEEIAQQRAQFNSIYNSEQSLPYNHQQNLFHHQPQPIYGSSVRDEDKYEEHHIDLIRDSTDSNWGIRLIGGAEAGRAISIGSIVFGGAASKNGQLKSGDEIVSINGINVEGATHRDVVDLISKCSNRARLVIRRNKYAEACEVILNRNLEEGFGFVIISKENCALIGRIMEGSPADRCQQLHVKDRIIGVNGRDIHPGMKHPEIVNMIKECGSTLRLKIIPADCYTVELIKNAQNDNFGFSMRGGFEYDGTPLYILRVASNGLARDLLNVGDQIIEINGIPTVGMTHHQAASIIKYSDPIVKLKLRRNYVTPPSLLVDSPRALQKYNQVTAEMKTVNQNPTPVHQIDPSTSNQGLNSIPSMVLDGHSNQRFVAPLEQQDDNNTQDNNAISYNHKMPLYAT